MSVPGYKPPDSNPNYNNNNNNNNYNAPQTANYYPTADPVNSSYNPVIHAQSYQPQASGNDFPQSSYSASSNQHQQSDQGYRGQPPSNFGSYSQPVVANQYQQQINQQQIQAPRGSCTLSPVILNGFPQYPDQPTAAVMEFISNHKSNFDYMNFVNLLNSFKQNNYAEAKKKMSIYFIVYFFTLILLYYIFFQPYNGTNNQSYYWIFWVFILCSIVRASMYRRSYYQGYSIFLYFLIYLFNFFKNFITYIYIYILDLVINHHI
jgi:hypothetical protein